MLSAQGHLQRASVTLLLSCTPEEHTANRVLAQELHAIGLDNEILASCRCIDLADALEESQARGVVRWCCP